MKPRNQNLKSECKPVASTQPYLAPKLGILNAACFSSVRQRRSKDGPATGLADCLWWPQALGAGSLSAESRTNVLDASPTVQQVQWPKPLGQDFLCQKLPHCMARSLLPHPFTSD